MKLLIIERLLFNRHVNKSLYSLNRKKRRFI